LVEDVNTKYASVDDGMLYLQYGDLEAFGGEWN
jgi:hypothetical protein